MDIRELTAIEVGTKISKKEISVPEATRAFLSAAKADFTKSADDTTKINAFISIDEEGAIKRARTLQEMIDKGEAPSSPLFGVPVAIKDNICINRGETTAASRILGGFKPPYNATVIEKLEAAGAVILGKANMDEFAMGSSTETSYYGIVRNPYDLTRVPGGSSGGSAAAVAARFAPYAIGSDTGGSIRQPCAFCGLTGVKPTYGSVSRYGLMAYASSLDQIGPLARDARDCAAILQIISGPDSRDSTSVIKKPFELSHMTTGFCTKDVFKNYKIGLPTNYFMEGMSDDVKESILKAAAKMRELGATVEEFELPLIEYGVPTYLIIACAEASSNLSRYDSIKYGYRSENAHDIRESYFVSRSEGFGREVRRRVMLGSFVLSSGYFDAYYKKALKVRSLIKGEFDKAFEKYDIILSPATPTVPFELGEKMQDPIAMYLADIYTVSVNLTGCPAVVLPCGTDDAGLPIGMQFVGDAFSEERLLIAAAAYQDATQTND